MLPKLQRAAELRQTARAQVRIPARYASENLVVEGVVTDVSPDGLFFVSDYLDSTGEWARISLDIPWRAAPLELRGEVRWVSEGPDAGGMGVRLVDTTLEDRMVLSSLGLSALAGVSASANGQP